MKNTKRNSSEKGGIIRINRTVSYADRLRAYRIFVDGEFVAKIKAGESLDLPVATGARAIVAKIDWCRSPAVDVDVKSGKTVDVQCGSNLLGLRVFLNAFYIFFLPHRYLTMRLA